jgi:GAF domain-containing protein
MISAGKGLNSVFDSIVRYTCVLTNSDACWLELRQKDSPAKMAITAAVNLSEDEKNLLEQSEGNTLAEWIINNKQPVLIHDLHADKRTLHLKLQQVSWKSLIAIPLIRESSVLGILFSAKKGVRVLNEKDVNTLTSFGVQANIALGNYPLTDSSLEDRSR